MSRVAFSRFLFVLVAPIVVGCSSTGSEHLAAKSENPSGIEDEIVLSQRDKEEPTVKMHIDFGYFFLQMGNSEKAAKSFRDAIDMDKRVPQPYIGLAKIYAQMNNPKKALEYLEQGSRHCRKSPEIWNEIGVTQMQLGNYEAATKAMQKALKYDPHSPLYIENFAAMLAVQGKYQESYDEYAKIVPPAEARFRIAGIAYGQGKVDQTKDQLQLALEANPKHESAYAMMQRLDEGGIIQAGYVSETPQHKLQSTSRE